MNDFIDHAVDEEDTWAIRPNKTQLKRDIALISDLCEEISQLAPAQIARLGIPENIEIDILEAAKMPLKSARKRQMKFVTARMRKIEIEPIQQELDKIKAKSAHAARELHQLERWRDRLLSDDKHALTEFLSLYANADIQHMRQLMRNAKKEASAAPPPRSSRLLFQYLRKLTESNSEPEA